MSFVLPCRLARLLLLLPPTATVTPSASLGRSVIAAGVGSAAVTPVCRSATSVRSYYSCVPALKASKSHHHPRNMAAHGKSTVVFVLGGPGSGKGTQCDNIVKTFGFVHLSAGDLLRAEKSTGSAVANMINTYIQEGKIVPVEVTVGLIDKAMQASPTKKFLIDGFPRNADNLAGWERVMADKVDVKFVLFLECPEDKCIERVMERGKSSGRNDDNIETLRKRFHTYETETRPIVSLFDERKLVRTIDSTQTVAEVFEDIKALFDGL